MQATGRLLQHRQPLIKFLGKRSIPKSIDHSPHPHPEAPSGELPESFAQYRNRAQQHGPLGGQLRSASTSTATQPYGTIGGHSAKELGPIQPAKGEFWDRNELPKRFHRVPWTEAEIEALESGGASQFA